MQATLSVMSPPVDNLFLLIRHANAQRLAVENKMFDNRAQSPELADLFATLRRIDATVEEIEAKAWKDIK